MKDLSEFLPAPGSKAKYSFVTLRTGDMKQVSFLGRDGHEYRVEGYVDGKCPTDICGGVCCKTSSLNGVVGKGPCEHFDKTEMNCSLHARFGIGVKPISCVIWPKSHIDIDTVNKQAERLGLKGRCQLKVVRINGNS